MHCKKDGKQQNRSRKHRHIRRCPWSARRRAEQGDRRAQRKADDKIIKPHAQQSETEILQDHLWMAVKAIVQQAHIAVIEHCAACLVPHGHKIHDKNEKWQKGHNLPRGLLCFCRVEEREEKPTQEYGKDDQQPDFDGLYQLATVACEKQGVEIGIALQMRITSGPPFIRLQVLLLDRHVCKRARFALLHHGGEQEFLINAAQECRFIAFITPNHIIKARCADEEHHDNPRDAEQNAHRGQFHPQQNRQVSA